MGVNISDVARAAGVSRTTVSRVFNNAELVKPETQERVRRVAAELRYIPNATARSLILRKTHVLGLVLPKPDEEFYFGVISGSDEAAHAAGYSLLITSTHNRLDEAKRALRTMHGRVDGLLLVSPHHDAATLADVLPGGIPIVFLQSSVGDKPYDCFRLANRHGAYQAVRHLIELGHHRIALIESERENIETQERLRGAFDAIDEAGLDRAAVLELTGSFTQQSGYEAGKVIAAASPRPTAVFAFDDYMAIGALRALQHAGLRVPEDVAIIGFDDVMSARLTTPALSSIRVPVQEMGHRALDRLVERVEADGDAEPAMVEMPTELVVRASTVGAAAPPESEAF